jgi:hypothetical protein
MKSLRSTYIPRLGRCWATSVIPSPCNWHVFATSAYCQGKATVPYQVGGKRPVRSGATVQIATKEVLRRNKPTLGVKIGGMSQHPLGNIWTTSTALFRKTRARLSFEQASCYVYCHEHLNVSSASFSSGFPTNNFHVFLFSHIHTTHPTYQTFLSSSSKLYLELIFTLKKKATNKNVGYSLFIRCNTTTWWWPVN